MNRDCLSTKTRLVSGTLRSIELCFGKQVRASLLCQLNIGIWFFWKAIRAFTFSVRRQTCLFPLESESNERYTPEVKGKVKLFFRLRSVTHTAGSTYRMLRKKKKLCEWFSCWLGNSDTKSAGWEFPFLSSWELEFCS